MKKLFVLILFLLTSCATSPERLNEMILGQHISVFETRLGTPTYHDDSIQGWEWSPTNIGAVISESLRGVGMAFSNASGRSPYQTYSPTSQMRLQCILLVVVDSRGIITQYQLNDRRCL